jgi:Spy/CpxP family protein refolding chaperone
MKINKFSLLPALVLGGLVACGSLAVAQDAKQDTKPDAPGAGAPGRRGGGMSVDQRLERMSTELELTAEQKPKVKAVLEESMKKMQEIRSDSNLAPEDRRTKMRTIREDESKAMKAILKPEQFDKYEKMAQQRAGGRGPGAGGPAPDAGAAPKKADPAPKN